MKKGQNNYRVLQIDTSVAQEQKVIPNGTPYDSVTVIAIPGGLVADLAFGDNKDFWPISAPDQFWEFQDDAGCPLGQNNGLLVRHNAVVGVLLLGVSLGAHVEAN